MSKISFDTGGGSKLFKNSKGKFHWICIYCYSVIFRGRHFSRETLFSGEATTAAAAAAEILLIYSKIR